MIEGLVERGCGVYRSPVGSIYVEYSFEFIERISFLPICREIHEIPSRVFHLLEKFLRDYFYRGVWTIFDELNWDVLGQREISILKRLQDTVPFGSTITYGELYPPSPRYAGQVLKRNPFPIVVPCHRVVSKNGIGGFTPSVEIKQWLLRHEGVLF